METEAKKHQEGAVCSIESACSSLQVSPGVLTGYLANQLSPLPLREYDADNPSFTHEQLVALQTVIDTDPNLHPQDVPHAHEPYLTRHQVANLLGVPSTLIWQWTHRLQSIDGFDLRQGFGLRRSPGGAEILIHRQQGVQLLEIMQQTRGKLEDLLPLIPPELHCQWFHLQRWQYVNLRKLASGLGIGRYATTQRIQASRHTTWFYDLIKIADRGKATAYFINGPEGHQSLVDVLKGADFTHLHPLLEASRCTTVADFCGRHGVSPSRVLQLIKDNPEIRNHCLRNPGQRYYNMLISPDGEAILLAKLTQDGPLVPRQISLKKLGETLGLERPNRIAVIIEEKRPDLIVRLQTPSGGGGFGNIYLTGDIEEAKYLFVTHMLGALTAELGIRKNLVVRAIVRLANQGTAKVPMMLVYDRRHRPTAFSVPGQELIDSELVVIRDEALNRSKLADSLKISFDDLRVYLTQVEENYPEIVCIEFDQSHQPRLTDQARQLLIQVHQDEAVARARCLFTSIINQVIPEPCPAQSEPSVAHGSDSSAALDREELELYIRAGRVAYLTLSGSNLDRLTCDELDRLIETYEAGKRAFFQLVDHIKLKINPKLDSD